MLWMRSDPGRSDSPRPAPGAPAEPAGSSILWQRGADGPPTSLEFPRGQQDMPDNRMEGDVGQVGPRRHISRSSALLDNVAPAEMPLPHRLPGRQPHVNGSRSQDRASAASEVTEPDEDPWTATRADLSSSENSGADSPAEWIALHDTLQVSIMQLCLTRLAVLQQVITEAYHVQSALTFDMIQSSLLYFRAALKYSLL